MSFDKPPGKNRLHRDLESVLDEFQIASTETYPLSHPAPFGGGRGHSKEYATHVTWINLFMKYSAGISNPNKWLVLSPQTLFASM